ncbi:MAG: rhodanese-related sulfurtransferase [Cyclobacteriaceae bacterium]|jgi:rhodanese-related sulfurtransferase
MKDNCMTFQQRGLFQQGFQQFTPAELKQFEWGLRFTPLVCSLIAAVGLFMQQPYILFGVSVLGFWAFFFPASHPMDLFYNHLIAPIFKAVKLPENPFQRRLACLSAGIMNLAAGALFLLGLPIAALVVGITLLILQAIVITTHFCTLSWMYEGAMRLLGKWQLPLEEKTVIALFNEGAVLVDVRSQHEFADGTIAGALNMPLENIEHCTDQLKAGHYLLFCASGTRSHIATEKLNALGINNIDNVGALSRVRALVGT